jgi:serine phosphatase RsbU (regulator of sigma subunit)
MTDRATEPADRGIEHAAGSEVWLRHTLGEILTQIRRLLDVSGCAFQVVDWDAGVIRPAAAWFATPDVRSALAPVLARTYEAERPGVTEAAIERGLPLLIQRFEEWEASGRLKERLEEQLDPEAAAVTWEWYRTSSFISCPVRTAGGRTLGVLAISSRAPHEPLGEADLRVVEVFADLAALALERSELLDREARRADDELKLSAAAQHVTSSLEVEAVYGTIVEEAQRLTGATRVALARFEPATADLRHVAQRGFSESVAQARFQLGEGMVGRVAQTGEPYLSSDRDADRFLSWVMESERLGSFVHVPVKLGPRLFGVLSAGHEERGYFDEHSLRLMVTVARIAAGAIANALNFERERRIAHALTRGFVAAPVPELAGLELGVVYEPTGHAVGGGDVFGAWTLPNGSVAVLIGDVAGKGVEVAAFSAMVRYFVEARTWDCDLPAEVLAQTNELLRDRLPSTSFVSAFMAVIDNEAVRYSNAGHSPVMLLRAGDGTQQALAPTGVPLGVEEDARYAEARFTFGQGDVLFAATDGLAEARRDGVYFRDARLPALLAQHATALEPAALVRRLYDELEQWTPQLDDDVVILALRRC